MELTELKRINNGAELVEKPSILDKMIPAGEVLGTTTGKSTLTDRKAINNLPKYNLGKINEWMDKKNSMFGTNMGAVTSSVGGAIDFVGGIASAGLFNTTADDALMDAGTSTGNIGGINYTRQNDVNAAQISALTGAENTANTVGLMGKGASLGASVGSVAGPVGGLIGGAVGAIGGLVGGLFGGAARKRKMRQMIAEAKDKAFRQNDFSRGGALTSLLQQQYAQQYGDTESQSLYGFADGKAFSAAGPTDGYNARVSNGEIIANKYTGEMFRVPGLPNNKDGKLAYIRPSDTIITNKYGLSDYVAETGDLEGGEAMMSSIMKAKGKKGYKCGKLPKFAWGLPEWTNLGTNAIGMIGSMVDTNKIENEPISNPDTRKANPFVNVALNTMANIKYNNYQAYNDLWDTAYKYRNAVNNNGNLSAAQRAVMNYAGYKDAMDSMAKLNQYAQETNNKYGQAYALMAAQLGEDQANRDQKAAMFDYEAYNQAHGARRLMASQRKADAMNYLNNWAKGLTDMHMWREQMGLWLDDINIRKADLKAKEDALKLNSFNWLGALKGAALGGSGLNTAVGMILGGLGYKPSNVKQSKVIEPVFGSDYAKRMYDALNITNSADSLGVEDTLNSFALDKAANYNSNKPVSRQNTNSYYAKVKNPYTKFTYDQFMKSNSITAKNMRKKWKGDNMNAYYNFLAMANGQLYHVK